MVKARTGNYDYDTITSKHLTNFKFVKKYVIMNTIVFEQMLFYISSKFVFFIGVDMVMCHALIRVKEIHQSLT